MLIAACSLQSFTINKVPGNTFTLQHDYAKPYKYIACFMHKHGFYPESS